MFIVQTDLIADIDIRGAYAPQVLLEINERSTHVDGSPVLSDRDMEDLTVDPTGPESWELLETIGGADRPVIDADGKPWILRWVPESGLIALDAIQYWTLERSAEDVICLCGVCWAVHTDASEADYYNIDPELVDQIDELPNDLEPLSVDAVGIAVLQPDDCDCCGARSHGTGFADNVIATAPSSVLISAAAHVQAEFINKQGDK